MAFREVWSVRVAEDKCTRQCARDGPWRGGRRHFSDATATTAFSDFGSADDLSWLVLSHCSRHCASWDPVMAGRSSTAGLRRGESDTTSSSKPSKPFWSWNPDRSLPTLTDTDPKWLSRRKHFFILSDAGKPVYSRYGDAGNLPGFTAALSAIIAGFEENLSSGGGGG